MLSAWLAEQHEERRVNVADGCEYTKAEFCELYGCDRGEAMWQTAYEMI